ncbi:MAG: MBL fold metallo-hydrolase [Chloroflexota bacterium]|nr:MBL fold metallo-hydrolase [Chloroflexota bacterium]
MASAHPLNAFGTIDLFTNDLFTLHSFMSDADGEFVRTQIIETATSVIVIDAQYLRKYAQWVRSYADGLGKPITRVIVTHGHPDHWLGLEHFHDLPTYAFAEVIAELNYTGDFWVGLKNKELGSAVTDKPYRPTNVLNEGREVIDGVEFVFSKIQGGEAATNTVIELPQANTLLAQDMIYNEMYPFVGELHGEKRDIRCFDGWRAGLRSLQGRGYDLVVPGHGAPTDDASFGRMIDILNEVEAILNSATDHNDFKAKVMARYPEFRLPLLLDYSVLTLYNLMG